MPVSPWTQPRSKRRRVRAGRRRRRGGGSLQFTSTRFAAGFSLLPLELEITPEPSAEERAAIVAALEKAEETPFPWREEDEEP
jgi:hypothetical protein